MKLIVHEKSLEEASDLKEFIKNNLSTKRKTLDYSLNEAIQVDVKKHKANKEPRAKRAFFNECKIVLGAKRSSDFPEFLCN